MLKNGKAEDSNSQTTSSGLKTLVVFVFQTLIRPWPFFAIFLLISSVLAALTPLLQIKATTNLVNLLAAQLQNGPPGVNQPIERLLSPSLPWLGLLFATMILSHLLYMDTFQNYLSAQMSERVRERLEQRFYKKAVNLSLEKFEYPAYYDGLQRARKALNDKQLLYQLALVQRIAPNLAGCIGLLVAFSALGWWVTLILVITSLALAFGIANRSRALVKLEFKQTPMQRRADYWRNLLTTKESAAEVRLFGLADYIIQGWKNLTLAMLKEVRQARRRNWGGSMLISLFWNAVWGFIILALVLSAASHNLTPGQVVAFLYASRQYSYRLGDLSWWLEDLARFFGELRYLPEFLSLKDEESTTGEKAPSLSSSGQSTGIVFENVSFTYPGSNHPALSNLSFELQPGEKLALVGENGAGKSTLVKLLLGLYRPTSGCIKVDGVDLQTVDPKQWRARLGAVFQEYMRYSFTAQENIGFGALEKLQDLNSIQAAARMSRVAQVIESLPQRYQTVLGKEFEGGHDLSGGQWQKLAIARAYLRDPQVLVLDEPASALDALAELEIYRQFLELSSGKSVLLISHRLGSARLADRILFLRQGQLVEQGTHQELMAAQGIYAELYQMQAEWYRVAAAKPDRKTGEDEDQQGGGEEEDELETIPGQSGS